MQPILTVLRLSVRDRPSEVANLRQASLERGGTLRVVSLNHITAATRTTRTLYTSRDRSASTIRIPASCSHADILE